MWHCKFFLINFKEEKLQNWKALYENRNLRVWKCCDGFILCFKELLKMFRTPFELQRSLQIDGVVSPMSIFSFPRLSCEKTSAPSDMRVQAVKFSARSTNFCPLPQSCLLLLNYPLCGLKRGKTAVVGQRVLIFVEGHPGVFTRDVGWVRVKITCLNSWFTRNGKPDYFFKFYFFFFWNVNPRFSLQASAAQCRTLHSSSGVNNNRFTDALQCRQRNAI